MSLLGAHITLGGDVKFFQWSNRQKHIFSRVRKDGKKVKENFQMGSNRNRNQISEFLPTQMWVELDFKSNLWKFPLHMHMPNPDLQLYVPTSIRIRSLLS